MITLALNLTSAVALVGGWVSAVWALHRGLGDPYLAEADQRIFQSAAVAGTENAPETDALEMLAA